MGWLYFLAVLALLCLIGAIPLRFHIRYRTEPCVTLGILFLRIPLVPGKKKKPRLRDYKIGRFRKRRLKERAKARENARRAAEKKAAKEAKKRAKQQKAAERPRAKKSLRERFEELKGKVDFGLEIAKGVVLPLVKRFGRYLRIEIGRICITAGGEDAAKTAQIHGIACAAVADLLELIDQTMHLKYRSGCEIWVRPDFTAEKTEIDLDLTLSLRICHILALPFGAIGDFLKILFQRA